MTRDVDFILSIATRRRFCQTFWRELARRRREDPSVTRREVFECLEDSYEAIFGEILWTWEAFRHSREFLAEL